MRACEERMVGGVEGGTSAPCADWMALDKQGRSLLHRLCERGAEAFAYDVMDWCEGSVGVADWDAHRPLDLAFGNGHYDLVTALVVAQPADAPVRRRMNMWTGAAFGDVGTVREWLTDMPNDVESDTRTVGQKTPLHWAAIGRSPDVARALLEAGADPNARDSHGRTPLHDGAHFCGRMFIATLLQHGADVNSQTAYDGGVYDGRPHRTPIFDAIDTGDEETVMMLVAAGTDLSRANALGHTPADYATQMGHDVLAHLLGRVARERACNGKDTQAA